MDYVTRHRPQQVPERARTGREGEGLHFPWGDAQGCYPALIGPAKNHVK